MKTVTASDIFKALSDPKRMRIVEMLSSNEGLCLRDIQDEFDVSQPTISHDMKLLMQVGLVTSRREGTHCIYTFQPATLASARDHLTDILSN